MNYTPEWPGFEVVGADNDDGWPTHDLTIGTIVELDTIEGNRHVQVHCAGERTRGLVEVLPRHLRPLTPTARAVLSIYRSRRAR